MLNKRGKFILCQIFFFFFGYSIFLQPCIHGRFMINYVALFDTTQHPKTPADHSGGDLPALTYLHCSELPHAQIGPFTSSPLLPSTLKRSLQTLFCTVDKISRQLQLCQSFTGEPEAEVIVLLLLSLEILFASI